MDREQPGGGKGREIVRSESPGELEQQDDVQHVQHHVAHVKTERPGAPDRTVCRVREVDDGTRERAEHNRADVRHVRNGGVLDNGVVIVVDERVAQGVEIHDAA